MIFIKRIIKVKSSSRKYEDYKDTLKNKNHENITQIREVIKSYGDVGKIYIRRYSNDC